MAKGENIFKRKDGRWEARYIKGYELSGKIKYGFVYGKTYREAKEKVTQAKAAIAGGKPTATSSKKHRFAYYCDAWLQMGKLRLKESTYVKYQGILENHVKPKLGGCLPQGITTMTANAFTQELLEQDGLSAKTVRDILTVTRSVLSYAQEQAGGIFPKVTFTYPREIKKEMRVLSRQEQERFIHYLLSDMDECKFGVLLALLTGMRIGEVCALRWEDVSMEERSIHVHATLQRLQSIDPEDKAKTRIIISEPKSACSVRMIPMSASAYDLCRQMQQNDPEAYLLTGTREFAEPRVVQYRLDKYTSECGLEGVHFHTLRHTFATRCVEVGFEIKSLSEILGHSTTTITLDRYVHSSMALKRDNMEKLTAVGM